MNKRLGATSLTVLQKIKPRKSNHSAREQGSGRAAPAGYHFLRRDFKHVLRVLNFAICTRIVRGSGTESTNFNVCGYTERQLALQRPIKLQNDYVITGHTRFRVAQVFELQGHCSGAPIWFTSLPIQICTTQTGFSRCLGSLLQMAATVNTYLCLWH